MFFNLRKAQSKISIFDDGDMRLDQVKIIARRIGGVLIEPSLDDPCTALCVTPCSEVSDPYRSRARHGVSYSSSAVIKSPSHGGPSGPYRDLEIA